MESYFLIWVAVLIISTIICYFVVKNVLKVVVTFLFIFALFVAITVSLTYSDVQELKQELGEEQILYLVHKDNTLLFPVVMVNMTEKHSLTQSTLAENQIALLAKQKNYRAILEAGAYYKIVAINTSAYDSDDIVFLQTIGSTQNAFSSRADAFETLHEDKNMLLFLFHGYKAGDVVVYPKTMAFLIMSVIPEDLVASIADEEA